jgi:hypothetical protein
MSAASCKDFRTDGRAGKRRENEQIPWGRGSEEEEGGMDAGRRERKGAWTQGGERGRGRISIQVHASTAKRPIAVHIFLT